MLGIGRESEGTEKNQFLALYYGKSLLELSLHCHISESVKEQ